MKQKNVIETLQEEVKIPKIVQEKANLAFAAVKAEAEQEKKEEKKKRKNVSRKKLLLLAAAAVLAAGTATVGATAYRNWSKSLEEGLRATEEQKERLEETKAVAQIGQTATDNGITITAQQSIVDNYYALLSFKVEGYKLEEGKHPGFEITDITVGGDYKFSWEASFYDSTKIYGSEVKTDGSLAPEKNASFPANYILEDGSMEYQIEMDNTYEKGYFLNKPIHVELRNMGTVEKTDYTLDKEGCWSFDWMLTGSNESKEYSLDVPLGDTGARVTNAEISPISIDVRGDFPRKEKLDIAIDQNGEKREFTTYEEMPQLTGMKMKDGTLLFDICAGGSYGYTSENTREYRQCCGMGRIIDIEEIDSLLFWKNVPEYGEIPTEENFYVVPLEEK